MKYFLHDSNSFNDEKVTQLYIKFGYEGLGLFYTILEKLALQEKPILTDVLKHQLKVGKKLNKIWLFMESIDLISSNNGETFSTFIDNIKFKETYVYFIRLRKNLDDFIKIGITYFLDKRYSDYGRLGYEVEELFVEKYDSKKEALERENYHHLQFEQYKYLPVEKFGGYTECFNPCILNYIDL